MKKYKVWECKIVIADIDLPGGFDMPPREAAIDAIEKIGIKVLGCASGWNAKLTKAEQKAFDEYITAGSPSVYVVGTMDNDDSNIH